VNLQSALAAHYALRQRLRDAIETGSEVDVDALGRESECDLGRWLAGPAARGYAGLPELGACQTAHVVFHQQAARLALLVNRKDHDLVAADLAGGSNPFADASSQVNLALLDLFRATEDLAIADDAVDADDHETAGGLEVADAPETLIEQTDDHGGVSPAQRHAERVRRQPSRSATKRRRRGARPTAA